ncbi:hypothetical protein ZWY2020_057542 [Hordeum vulgare]|nr:hypothetical protein ZWY2020_057542 [Hordeum vulgare]
MAPPSSPPSAAVPSRGSSAKAAPEADQEASVTKRPCKGTSSGKKKTAPKAAKKQQKATKAPREKKEKASENPAAEDEVCGEEPNEEELALGEEDKMAASGEQHQEMAAAAKSRVSQPTKKARNVAAGDTEPEFLGKPVPVTALAFICLPSIHACIIKTFDV